MAYEIQIDIGTAGLTDLYCRPWQGTSGGAAIALTEIAGAGGVYGNAGDLSLAEGEYILRGYDSADSLIARSGLVAWDGAAFVSDNGGLTPTQAGQLSTTAATVATNLDVKVTSRLGKIF